MRGMRLTNGRPVQGMQQHRPSYLLPLQQRQGHLQRLPTHSRNTHTDRDRKLSQTNKTQNE